MGYALSWVAFPRDGEPEVLHALKLARTGKYSRGIDAEFLISTGRSKLAVVLGNDPMFADSLPLARLSKKMEIVACALDERIMASGASGFAAGKERWCVAHDSQKKLSHLRTTGSLPAYFVALRSRAEKTQQREDQEDGEVDYYFDLPIDLARRLTGFRHDRIASRMKFEELVRK